MGVDVKGSDGRVWHVRRRFRWPSFRAFGPDERHDIIAETGMGLGAIGFFILVGAILVFFVLPVVVFIGELLVAFAALVFLGGSWLIEAETEGPPAERLSWTARGLRES